MALAEWCGISYSLFSFLPVGQEPGGVRDFEAGKLAVGLTRAFVEPDGQKNESFYHADTLSGDAKPHAVLIKLREEYCTRVLAKRISVDCLEGY